jgi:hypothetical protein
MVILLGKFFTSSSQQGQALQGLQSKVTLISTFSTHNDRLHNVLTLALKPYEHMNIEVRRHYGAGRPVYD